MELRHLTYFKAVAEELNFRKAADRLFISQPGLSRQIKQLEEELQAPLFDRNKKQVKLTAAGTYLKEEVDFVLNHLKITGQQVREIAEGREGELRIGFLGSAANQVLPDLLSQLNRLHPAITTSLEELSNQEQIGRIQKDKLDLGFVRVASLPEGLQRKVVHRDTFSVVVPQNHPLQPADFHSLGQFANASFILFSSDYSKQYYEQILGLCSAAGFYPQIKHKSVHALTIFRLVAIGMGVAIVPSSLLIGYDVPVRGMVIPDNASFTELNLIWKASNRNPVLGKVLELV